LESLRRKRRKEAMGPKLTAPSQWSHLGETSRVEVAGVYFLHRMTKRVRQRGKKGEIALDLTTTDENGDPWDLNKQKMREKAILFLKETKPAVLCRAQCSQPCRTLTSTK
jgi:hypothetical protein